MTVAQTREVIAYEMVDDAIASLRAAAGWFDTAHKEGRARAAGQMADNLVTLFGDRPTTPAQS